MELRSHMISERTAPADHIIADRGAAGICGCGPLRDHVASQLHDHRWIAPAPRRPRSRSNTQLNRPSTDYATALASPCPTRTLLSKPIGGSRLSDLLPCSAVGAQKELFALDVFLGAEAGIGNLNQ